MLPSSLPSFFSSLPLFLFFFNILLKNLIPSPFTYFQSLRSFSPASNQFFEKRWKEIFFLFILSNVYGCKRPLCMAITEDLWCNTNLHVLSSFQPCTVVKRLFTGPSLKVCGVKLAFRPARLMAVSVRCNATKMNVGAHRMMERKFPTQEYQVSRRSN